MARFCNELGSAYSRVTIKKVFRSAVSKISMLNRFLKLN